MKNSKSILFATLTVAIVSCDSNEIIQEGTDLIASNSEFITLRSGATVEKQADTYVWQDDILLSQAQYELLDETGDNATNEPTVDPTYGFAYPYVNFCDGSANQSYVGRIDGRQDLTLIQNGCSVGTVIHEIGHAIGLLHEQCRFDRDDYITVNTSNIQSSHQSNFTKRTSNYYCIGSFDFNSIMLYSSYTGFEVNTSIPSMTKKDGSTFVGQRNGLSSLDRRFPNSMYVPYIARSDVYRELATTVYKPDNTIMTAAERLQLQAELNDGNPNPPANGRIPNNF